MLIDKDGNETLLALDMSVVKRSQDTKKDSKSIEKKHESPADSPRSRKKSHHTKKYKDEERDSVGEIDSPASILKS